MKCSKESKLIQSIYDSHGGTRATARMIGYSYELLSKWKLNGRVPLRKVAEVAKKLNCNPFSLNNAEVLALTKIVDLWRE